MKKHYSHTSAIVVLAAFAIDKLKLMADFRNMRLPALSDFHAFINAKSPVIASSRINGFPSNVLD